MSTHKLQTRQHFDGCIITDEMRHSVFQEWKQSTCVDSVQNFHLNHDLHQSQLGLNILQAYTNVPIWNYLHLLKARKIILSNARLTCLVIDRGDLLRPNFYNDPSMYWTELCPGFYSLYSYRFCGEIRKISTLFHWKECAIKQHPKINKKCLACKKGP